MCISFISKTHKTIDCDTDILVSNSSYYKIKNNSYVFKNIIKNILNQISRFFALKNNSNSLELKCHNEGLSKTSSQKILNINNPPLKSLNSCSKISIENISNNILFKTGKKFLSLLDFIFVKHLIHAKACDIAFLAMMGFIVLASTISIFAPHLTLLNFALLGKLYSQPIFGILNATVGLAVGVQSIKNLKKGIATKNKEEIVIGIISIFYSMAIATTGVVAFANFSNSILLKSLFTICAGFGLGIGSYNFLKTQTFRKQLKDAQEKNKVKEFLREKITVSKNEIEILKTKIDKLRQNELEEKLRKILTKIQFEKIQNESIEKKKKELLDIELKIIQKRKSAKLEKLLRSEITKNIKTFVKSYKNKDEDLEKKIYKELNKRTIAESLRILAPSLSIAAFGINQLSLFATSQVQDLVYYSMMLASKLSGFWLNYVPSWRNVARNDKKTKNIDKVSQNFFIKKTIQVAG